MKDSCARSYCHKKAYGRLLLSAVLFDVEPTMPEVTRVEELLRDTIQEVCRDKSNTATKVQLVVDQLIDIVGVLPIAYSLAPMHQYGLLRGLLDPDLEPHFRNRVNIETEQKQNLAKYCLSECGLSDAIVPKSDSDTEPTVKRIFLESGSTIAHCVGHLASHIFDTLHDNMQGKREFHLPFEFLTNNLFGVTALTGLVHNVEPIQGKLDLKYFGFFPFAEDDLKNDARRWGIESARYNTLSAEVRQCESVFATCSGFGFLTGPVVGSRPNCITKRAMYSGAHQWEEGVKRTFYLLLHYQKLIPFVKDFKGIELDNVRDRCGCVFAKPSKNVQEAKNAWLAEKDHSDFNVLLSHFEERLDRTPDSIPVPIMDMATASDEQGLDIRDDGGLRHSWCRWMTGSRGMNILISLPEHDGDAEWPLECLKREITRANEILKLSKSRWGYNLTKEDAAWAFKVAHVKKVEITQALGL